MTKNENETKEELKNKLEDLLIKSKHDYQIAILRKGKLVKFVDFNDFLLIGSNDEITQTSCSGSLGKLCFFEKILHYDFFEKINDYCEGFKIEE